MYYLQSRYYNPTVGRFINADAFVSTGQGILGNNMFAYCGNNPVVRSDCVGAFWTFVASVAAGAVVNVATTFIAAKVTGQDYTWVDCLVAAGAGAINAVPEWGPIVNGLITGGYAGYMCYQNGGTVGEVLLCSGFSALCSTASISNLSAFSGTSLDLTTTAFVDLVFGTGNNSMAAAVYKVSITSPVQSDGMSSIEDVSDGSPNQGIPLFANCQYKMGPMVRMTK